MNKSLIFRKTKNPKNEYNLILHIYLIFYVYFLRLIKNNFD